MSVQCHLRPLGSLSYFLYSILLVLPCSMNLEKAMAPHSSTLAWKIPWMEEPGGLQSMGLLRVGHDWATSLSLSCIGGGNGNPLQCSCLENPRDGRAWWAAIYGVAQSRTRLKWHSSSSIPLFNLNAEYTMRNAGLEEAQAGIKIARRNLNNLRYADDTTLLAESEEELKKKPLDESERGEWKSWLKAQHSENKDHGIWSHHFMGNRWGNSGNSLT